MPTGKDFKTYVVGVLCSFQLARFFQIPLSEGQSLFFQMINSVLKVWLKRPFHKKNCILWQKIGTKKGFKMFIVILLGKAKLSMSSCVTIICVKELSRIKLRQ